MRTTLLNKFSVIGEQYVRYAMQKSEDVRRLMADKSAIEEFRAELIQSFSKNLYVQMDKCNSKCTDVYLMYWSLAWVCRKNLIESDLWDELRWSLGIEVYCGDICSAIGILIYLFKNDLILSAESELNLLRAYREIQKRNKRLREEAGI